MFRDKRKDVIYLGILFLLQLFYLVFSWNKWGNPLIDTFRELNVAEKYLQGLIPYSDFSYSYGLIPLQFSAFFLKLFGIHLNSIFFGNIFIIFIFSFILFCFVKFIFRDTLLSFLSTLLFLSLCAFGEFWPNSITNFIAVFSNSNTLTALTLLIASFCTLQFYKNKKKYELILSLFFQTLAILSRQEYGLLYSLGLTSFVIFFKFFSLRLGLLFLSPILFASIYLLIFLPLTSFDDFFHYTLYQVWLLKNHDFHLQNAGLLNPLKSISLVFIYFFKYSAIFLLGHYISKIKNFRFQIFYVGIVFLCYFYLFNIWEEFAFFPLIFLISIIILIKHKNRITFEFGLVLLLTLIGNSRNFLNTQIHFQNNSFFIFNFLLMFSLLTYLYKDRFKNINYYLLIFISVCSINLTLEKIYDRNFQLESSKFSIKIANQQIAECLNFINNKIINMNPKSLTVFPEGQILNYMTNIQNRLPISQFNPTNIAIEDEKRILALMESNQPDLIVVVKRLYPEFNRVMLGIDFGQNITNYIAEKYKLEHTCGQFPFQTINNDFGIAIYRQK